MPTVKRITEELHSEILSGVLGKSGDYFYSIRELAKTKNISYVSAQKATTELRKKGLVFLVGNHQYLSYGPLMKDTPLSEYLQKYRCDKKRIGMYINRLTNEFFASITEHISTELSKNCYELIILNGNGTFESEKNALESFVTLGAEAVISCPGYGEEISEVYKNYVLPTVFVGRYPNNFENSTAVLVNNVNAGRQIASHFIENGCKSYIYVGASQLKNEKDMRLEGYKKQLLLENIKFNSENVIYIDYEKNTESRAKFKEVYKRCEKPVGIFCFHDMLAVRIMGICNRYNIEIPKDVLLAGVDNLSLCEVVSPRLTSISYRVDIMAHTVVDAVFTLINEPDKVLGHKYINQSLIARKSTVNTV